MRGPQNRKYRKELSKEIKSYTRQVLSKAGFSTFNRKGKYDKERKPYTHFVSIPLATESIKKVYIPWKDAICEKKYPGILNRCFINPKIIHLTLMMLPLGEAGMVERARQTLIRIEPKIKELISTHSPDGKLKVEFDKFDIFGTPEECRVIFVKLKEEGDQYELIQEINGIVIQAMIDDKVIDRSELSHVKKNKEK